MIHYKSDNYDKFFCIAGECPESCCTGWQIMIDDESLERYRRAAEGEDIGIEFILPDPDRSVVTEADEAEKQDIKEHLRQVLSESIDWEEECFKHKDGKCVLMTEGGLCSLQRAYGEAMLCRTCAAYPRHMEEFENVREWSLSLSCPEAARLILSRTEKLSFSTWETDERDDPSEYEGVDGELYLRLAEARGEAYRLIQNRDLSFRAKAIALAAFAAELQDCLDLCRIDEMDAVIRGAAERYAAMAGEVPAPSAFAETDADREECDPLSRRLFSKMFELEVLRPGWLEIVDKTWQSWDDELILSPEDEIRAEQLLMFWVYTYFCGAVYDELIYGKMMLAVCSTWWIFQINKANAFDGGLVEAAYKFAREIEHSDENLNALEDWFDHGE
ncbi:MAG: flagellin lysine-N-methylase [Eubacteriales bacterium]|nr:flagellin lysine-N-methylase [Eubacteriales bacterium]